VAPSPLSATSTPSPASASASASLPPTAEPWPPALAAIADDDLAVGALGAAFAYLRELGLGTEAAALRRFRLLEQARARG